MANLTSTQNQKDAADANNAYEDPSHGRETGHIANGLYPWDDSVKESEGYDVLKA